MASKSPLVHGVAQRPEPIVIRYRGKELNGTRQIHELENPSKAYQRGLQCLKDGPDPRRQLMDFAAAVFLQANGQPIGRRMGTDVAPQFRASMYTSNLSESVQEDYYMKEKLGMTMLKDFQLRRTLASAESGVSKAAIIWSVSLHEISQNRVFSRSPHDTLRDLRQHWETVLARKPMQSEDLSKASVDFACYADTLATAVSLATNSIAESRNEIERSVTDASTQTSMSSLQM